MSRIGKLPIKLTDGVTAEKRDMSVSVVGPKGEINVKVPEGIKVTIDKETIRVLADKNDKKTSSLFGTTRANISNAVLGVSTGWSKSLEMVGTGFRAEVNDNVLTLTVGYSHPVKIEAPDGISFKVEKSVITVGGINKEMVGQISAKIREVRPPEPYKGKGIKYAGEIVRRKAGKVAKAVGTA